MSIFHHLGHLYKESAQITGSLELLVKSLFFMVRGC
jgi:hypothetical protein